MPPARLLDALALETPFSDNEILDAAHYLVQVSPLHYETAADITAQTAALTAAGLDTGFRKPLPGGAEHHHDRTGQHRLAHPYPSR